MPEFDVDAEPIHVFEIDNTYLFKFYFERQDLFSELSEFYEDERNRFEMPESVPLARALFPTEIGGRSVARPG